MFTLNLSAGTVFAAGVFTGIVISAVALVVTIVIVANNRNKGV